jgi:hypothetical protein
MKRDGRWIILEGNQGASNSKEMTFRDMGAFYPYSFTWHNQPMCGLVFERQIVDHKGFRNSRRVS